MHDDGVDYEDDELPDGVYHDDEWATVPCPYCRAEIAEGSPRCPRCENWISREERPGSPKTWFWWAMMALAVACALVWLLGN